MKLPNNEINNYKSNCLIGCGSPVSTRKKFIDGEADPTATIKQAPWMVSLGSWEKGTFTSWIHECAGSLITESHVQSKGIYRGAYYYHRSGRGPFLFNTIIQQHKINS